MAEAIPDLRKVPKARAYAELRGHTDAILDGVDDQVTAMATMARSSTMRSDTYGQASIE